jgi:adenylate cyclase
MFTDLSGFSRGVAQFGIIHFLQIIQESQRILIPLIENHDGILLKTEGDSFLVIFRNVGKALSASIEMQKALLNYNVGKPEEEMILLCIGLGFGKMLRIGDSDVFGEEVNAASKLGEDKAKAWEILVTEAVREHASDLAGVEFKELEFEILPGKRAFQVDYMEIATRPSGLPSATRPGGLPNIARPLPVPGSPKPPLGSQGRPKVLNSPPPLRRR